MDLDTGLRLTVESLRVRLRDLGRAKRDGNGLRRDNPDLSRAPKQAAGQVPDSLGEEDHVNDT